MNDVKKQYFREIKRLLPCNAKAKKRCIMELKSDVEDFLGYCPDATFDALCSAIGSPQAVAKSFLEDTDPEQISHKVSAKRKIIIGVVAVIAVLAIILSVIAFLFLDELTNYHHGYYVEYCDELPSAVLPSAISEY